MVKENDRIQWEGTVVECLRDATFRVELPNGHRVLAHVSGRIRKNFIKILPYDRVLVEMSPVRPQPRPDHLPLPHVTAHCRERRSQASVP